MTLGAEGKDVFEVARGYLASRQPQEALACLQPVIAADPGNAEAHSLMGIALGMWGELAESIRHLETATRLAPQNAAYFFNLGQAREREGDRFGAMSAYQQALQINPAYQRAAEAQSRLGAAPSQPATRGTGLDLPGSPQPAARAPWLDPSYTAAAASVESARNAPPVIGGPRHIADAPQIIKSIRWLYGLFILLFSMGLLSVFLGGQEEAQTPAEKVPLLVFCLALIGLSVWLMIAVPRGNKIAYYVQLVLSGIGLLGFPIGTLIHGYILYHWVQPETKAWFGVS